MPRVGDFVSDNVLRVSNDANLVSSSRNRCSETAAVSFSIRGSTSAARTGVAKAHTIAKGSSRLKTKFELNEIIANSPNFELRHFNGRTGCQPSFVQPIFDWPCLLFLTSCLLSPAACRRVR